MLGIKQEGHIVLWPRELLDKEVLERVDRVIGRVNVSSDPDTVIKCP